MFQPPRGVARSTRSTSDPARVRSFSRRRSGTARRLGDYTGALSEVYGSTASLVRKERAQPVHGPLGLLDAILEARAAGVAEDRLQEVYRLQRKAMWRLDYISSENSRGFHADQEAMRILAESIDYSRQAQSLATRLRAPAPPSIDAIDVKPVIGVTSPAGAAAR